MLQILSRYQLGDMQCFYYIEEESKNVELMLLPAETEALPWDSKKQTVDSLVQLKVAGDIYTGGYAGGNTMRQSESTASLSYQMQKSEENAGKISIYTKLMYQDKAIITHVLEYRNHTNHVETYVVFENTTTEALTLEMLSSFSLGGLSPYIEGDSHEQMLLHRLRSVWSMEGRLESRTMEELQLEPSWAGHAVRSERFGQVGSMPVNHYFPYMVIEDKKSKVFWGAQLMHNASWQMEAYRKDEGISISGGLADREFGHWMKTISPKEQFTTPRAILSVCVEGGVDYISQRMTEALQEAVENGPESEQDLPIIFNEYCTTWGCPSHENITKIIDKIKDKGFSYFVIDCGWYKKDGVPWDIMMGDYRVSKELFPNGLQKTVDLIKENGMKPGIWFEIDNVGSAAEAYQDEAHLLKRDGAVLTTSMRRFWDMKNPWVEEYLSDKVIGTLTQYGFEYMKIDYNDTIGLGCDGAESLGEGLRQNMEASFAFLEKVKREVPDIILENCASGGQKLEPKMMQLSSMASFSDAHECEEIPVIAANLHRAILPRQSQIWAVIRKEDSLKRIAYSVSNTFLGRMCISGDVIELSTKQWEVLENGISFYKKIASIIKKGRTYRYGTKLSSYRNLTGWQGILRVSEQGKAYAVFHVFQEKKGTKLEIEFPKGTRFKIMESYSDSVPKVEILGNTLIYEVCEDKKAVAILLEEV